MNRLRTLLRLVRYGFPLRRPHLPLLILFHITTRCNMACRHCGDDVWGNPRDDLTLDEIAKFSASLGTFESLALGGGEPFLRKDLVEICKLFAVNNNVSNISIPSNGFASESICTAARSILTECPELPLNIMLSLDGFQETHDAIRTQGSFAKVLETGRKLKGLATTYHRLSLSFNATINKINVKELPALAQFVHDNFQARLDFNIISGTPRDRTMMAPSREELEKTLDELMDFSKTSQCKTLYNKVYRDILLETNFGTRQIIPCRAGSHVCLVDANGDLRSCPMLPPLGNLRTSSFGDIWQSRKAREQFRSIIHGDCACNNDCFIRLSLMNYWKLPFFMLEKFLDISLLNTMARKRITGNCPDCPVELNKHR